MNTEENNIPEQIEQLANNENLDGLNQLVEGLTVEKRQQYGSELMDAYHEIYSVWYSDLVCEKIKEEQREGFVDALFEVIISMEKIFPGNIQHELRAQCYRYLAEIKKDKIEKESNIEKAIGEYLAAFQKNGNSIYYAQIADSLLEKAQLGETYLDIDLEEILRLFELGFREYSEPVFNLFQHAAFQILNFSFEKKPEWHHRFLNQLNNDLNAFAKKNALVYLTWSNGLISKIECKQFAISPEYENELIKQSIDLLEGLIDYKTMDTQVLKELGRAFEKVAIRMESTSNNNKLHFYETSFGFFEKTHSINPAAWTYTLYATTVLLKMARIYFAEKKPTLAKEVLDKGKEMFSKTYEYDQGFSLTLRFGEYLIEYARLLYDFKAPPVLEKATAMLQIAKREGNGYYSVPYLGLAKIALKSGDKQKCLEQLYECKKDMAAKSYDWKFEGIEQDEDFREIWSLLK